jgi:hypothetical protein
MSACSVALATVFAASFVTCSRILSEFDISSFVIHGTFCSFPEHHQWTTYERTELTGSAIPQPRDREGSGRAERERASYNVAGAGLQLPDEAIKELIHAALLRWLGPTLRLDGDVLGREAGLRNWEFRQSNSRVHY